MFDEDDLVLQQFQRRLVIDTDTGSDLYTKETPDTIEKQIALMIDP